MFIMTYKDPTDPRARAARRKHYAENKEQYRERNRQARVRAQEYVLAYLRENHCVDCGESDVRCLQFDHRDASLKASGISKMIAGGYNAARLQAEIDKCDVRCANCHSKRTCAQFGWYKNISDSVG